MFSYCDISGILGAPDDKIMACILVLYDALHCAFKNAAHVCITPKSALQLHFVPMPNMRDWLALIFEIVFLNSRPADKNVQDLFGTIL